MNILLKNVLWCIMKTRNYRKTYLSSHKDETENNSEVTITAYESKEADQRLDRHTLHCLSSSFSYDKFVMHTIDSDVMAYLSDILWKNLNVLVYAKMLKSGVYYNIRTMILTLDHLTCVAHPFFYAFLIVCILRYPAQKPMRNVNDNEDEKCEWRWECHWHKQRM